MSSIPPPPPEGFEGVYPPQKKPSLLGQAASLAKSTAKSTASTIAAKASEVDAKYELSKQAKDKGSGAKSAVAKQAHLSTPEERQQWLDAGVTVATIASVLGGPKTKAAATVASLALPVMSSANQPAQPAAAGEVLSVEVVANVPAGQRMRVQLEDKFFELVVPQGVQVGQPFIAEIELEPASAPAVPMGKPVSNNAPAPGGRMGELASGMALARDFNQMGVSPAQAMQANQVRKDLGVTPTQALQGARAANQVRQDLGITPAQALQGASGVAKLMGAAQPSGRGR